MTHPLNKHNDAPDHWFGEAPNFSRRVAQAAEAVTRAEAALLEALKTAYPYGAKVHVYHRSGSTFRGTVLGWDAKGARVCVQNARSGKAAKWWAAQVQLADGSTP